MANATESLPVAPCQENCFSRTNFTILYGSPSHLFSVPVLTGVTVACVLLFAIGVTGNVLTVLIVSTYKEMRTTTNLYLSSMALSDLFIFLCMPLDLYKLWRHRPWSFGEVLCKLSQFVTEGCTYASILHITALSMERYFAVCFPLRAKVAITKTKIKGVILVLWTLALLSAGPIFVLVGVEFENGTDPARTSECKCTAYAVRSGLLNTMMWVSNLYFFVPVCCLTVLYGIIGRKLWKRRRNHRERGNRQTVKMLAVIVLTFVLCWLPFHIGRNLFSISSGTLEMYQVVQYLKLVSLVLFYLNAAINPILYNLMSGRYRAAVCKMVGLRRLRRRERRGSHLECFMRHADNLET
uniref:Growth hormone secretagogue receptor type 1 n=2 Tax=Latimeria chalumnae TaxID=7897 RepID=H3ADG1_LATCH